MPAVASIAARVYRLNVAQVHLWGTTAGLRPIPYAHVLTLLERLSGGRRLAVTALPLPQPGDSDKVLKQKANLRSTVFKSMKAGIGRFAAWRREPTRR